MNPPGPPGTDRRKAWDAVRPLIVSLLEEVSGSSEWKLHEDSALALDDAASTPWLLSTPIGLALSAAADSLVAADCLLNQRIQHVSAPALLGRVAIETAATGLWILSPDERAERVRRVLGWWRENQKQKRNAHSTVSVPNVETALTDDYASILLVADRSGLTEQDVERAQKANVTDILKSIGKAHLVQWQIGSGLAHGRPWAYLFANEVEFAPADRPGVFLARTSHNRDATLDILLAGADLLLQLHTVHRERCLDGPGQTASVP